MSKLLMQVYPYHTSLDVLMRLITKGVFYNPDLLLIHTGINDVGPLTSPRNTKLTILIGGKLDLAIISFLKNYGTISHPHFFVYSF